MRRQPVLGLLRLEAAVVQPVFLQCRGSHICGRLGICGERVRCLRTLAARDVLCCAGEARRTAEAAAREGREGKAPAQAAAHAPDGDRGQGARLSPGERRLP
eukprot:COSAG06_NODE_5905_length_3216_cov_31.226923_5_plen_101_part_01